MIEKFTEEIYGKIPASFPIPFPPNEGAKILSEESKRVGIFIKNSVIGKSSVSDVTLHVSIPSLTSNSFAPYFYGRFISENGETKLVGNFTLHPFVQVFITIYFAMTALFGILFLLIGLGEKSFAGFIAGVCFMLLCFGFTFIGYVFVRMCKKLNAENIQKIKDHISKSYRNKA